MGDDGEGKRCTRCGVVKGADQFHRRGKGGAGRHSACKECTKAAARADYAANPSRRAKVAASNKHRKAENIAFLREHLRAHPCVDCGETDLAVLEFDHVRGEKTSEVSKLVKLSLARIKSEVALCDVRCANCHRRKTVRECGWWIHAAVQTHLSQRR